MLSSQLCGDGKWCRGICRPVGRLSISTYMELGHNQSLQGPQQWIVPRVGRAFGFWRGDHLQRWRFHSQIGCDIQWVVLGLSCPATQRDHL